MTGSVTFYLELRESAIEGAHDDFLGRDAEPFGFGGEAAVAVGRKEGNRAGSEVPKQQRESEADDGGNGAGAVERHKRLGGFDGDVSHEVNGEGDARQPQKNEHGGLNGRPGPAPGEGDEVAAGAASRLGRDHQPQAEQREDGGGEEQQRR